MIENYEEKIEKEAQFWAHECSCPRGISKNPINIWDDQKVESIMRGQYQQIIVNKAAENSNNRVLELGCGQGWLSLEVAKRGIQVDAYDLSPQLIQMAKEKSKELISIPSFKPPHFEVNDLNKITFEPESYDMVMIWDALHHILEAERLLTETRKTLKKDGVLILLDHIFKPSTGGTLLAKSIALVLPTDLSFKHKVKDILITIKNLFGKSGSSNYPTVSPFEDITGVEMIEYIDRLFKIQKKIFLLSFSHHFVARIRMWDSIRLPLIRMLKRMDDLLIRLHILQGEYVFILAVKE